MPTFIKLSHQTYNKNSQDIINYFYVNADKIICMYPNPDGSYITLIGEGFAVNESVEEIMELINDK